MRSAWGLAWLRIRRHPVSTAILVLCLGLTIALPWTGRVLVADYRTELLIRAADTPLVLGERGDRFDVVLSALYFRNGRTSFIPFPATDRFGAEAPGVVVPISARAAAQGAPLVGTTLEYFEQRGLRISTGDFPVYAGEVVLGATLAHTLELGVGDSLFSDVTELYDLAVPPALKMRVCGVLAPSDGADDGAAFVDLTTCWVLEGFAHGHDDPAEIDPEYVLGGDETGLVISDALLAYQEITFENLADFHDHGDPERLPLTALLYWPASEKDGTLVRTRVNQRGNYQMLRPVEVVDELLAYVLRVKQLMDGLSWVLGTVTLALGALVYALSSRLRDAEFRTLRRMGCPPSFVMRLVVGEVLAVFLCAVIFAAVTTYTVRAALGDLTGWLR
ncbi:MAG: ABC transporter permease [Planctomycetes bacterium]|nr:ABC transporter permease [Planctomycetota bacterium]